VWTKVFDALEEVFKIKHRHGSFVKRMKEIIYEEFNQRYNEA